MNGVAALNQLARAHHGLGRARGEGLGIPGPYGQVPSQMIPAGTYEVSGTEVAFRQQPNLSESNPPRTNVLDQIDTTGETGSGSGYTWIKGTMKNGPLAGQTGFIAAQYIAPVGWTVAHGGGAQGGGGGGGGGGGDQGGGGGGSTPPVAMTGEPSEKWKPWLIGGIAALGAGGLLYLLFGTKTGKKARRRGKARRRLRRIRRSRKR